MGARRSDGPDPAVRGIVIATLALVAYDGLLIRIEKLAGSLDRLGAETIDAIAMTAPVSSPPISLGPVASRPSASKPESAREGSHMPARVPHQPHSRPYEGSDKDRRSSLHESGF